MTISLLSGNRALCRDIDRMSAVSQQAAHRPIFPVKPGEPHQLLGLISQQCIGKHVPLAVNDFERLGML